MDTLVLKVEYPTCHPRIIESTAVALAGMIFHGEKSIGNALIGINTSAVCRTSHTRTVSLVVQKLLRELRWRNTELYYHAREEALDLAVMTFIDYWKVMLSDPPGYGKRNSIPINGFIDPLAMSAYVGDLYALQLLPADMLKACITFLVNRVRTPFHLRCVAQLLNHANTSEYTRQLDVGFLLDCIGAIQRSRRYIKHISPEDDALTRLIHDLLFQSPHKIKHFNRWDRHLSNTAFAIGPTLSFP